MPSGVAAFLAGLVGLTLGAGSAHAYETDQITGRAEPIGDAVDLANAEANRLLDEVVGEVNGKTGCAGTPDETRIALAKGIERAFANHELVRGRGPIAALGHGRYAAAMERSPDALTFTERQDIYGDLSIFQAVILSTAGACSTLRFGDHWLGTDKLHHFFSEGYLYFRKSRWGEDPRRGVRWGTQTERTIYGLWSSLVFSFADLEANWDGYVFYDTLLQPGSVLGLDDQGCAVRTRDWSWLDIVDDTYDEARNPPVYTKKVERGVSRRLDGAETSLCVAWQAGAIPEADLTVDMTTVEGRIPTRTDPFRMAERCDATDPDGSVDAAKP
jgi:hypothetical protein